MLGALAAIGIGLMLAALPDSEAVHWLTVALGGGLFGVALAFVSAYQITILDLPSWDIYVMPRNRLTRYRYWRRRARRMQYPHIAVSIALLLAVWLVSAGHIYGMPVFRGIFSEHFDIVVAALYVISLWFIAFFTIAALSVFLHVAESRFGDAGRVSFAVTYGLTLGGCAYVTVWIVALGPAFIDAAHAQRTIAVLMVAFLLARTVAELGLLLLPDATFRAALAMAVPVVVVLVPLTAYLTRSGI
jgi:hypothetical protein